MPNYMTADDRLTVILQTITEDNFAPVDISAHFDRETDALTKFSISPMLPDATIPAGATPEATAAAVANQLDQWAGRFAAAAGAIRGRFA